MTLMNIYKAYYTSYMISCAESQLKTHMEMHHVRLSAYIEVMKNDYPNWFISRLHLHLLIFHQFEYVQKEPRI